MDNNPFAPPSLASAHIPEVEVLEWATFAWPNRQKSRAMAFDSLRPRDELSIRIIQFYQELDSKLLESDGYRLLFRREQKMPPWYSIRPVISGYEIVVDLSEVGGKLRVTCTYRNLTGLNVCDQKSGPFLEVKRLAHYCS